jgi:amidase
MSDKGLTRLTASEAVGLLRRREVSPLELVDAALARIEAVDGAVNALPTVCAERARAHARRLTDAGAPSTALGGLPLAVKDLNPVAGVRTTYGSRIFRDHVPESSDPVVDRIEAAGGIVLAKSNTPEFGSSGNTSNEVFGATRNPWNTNCTAGGSTGGGAAALATGMVWLATGSDLSGSLRQPASFCGVVGLRPSQGRVPRARHPIGYMGLTVEGPMARTVADCALLLDAMSGFDPYDPLSRPAEAGAFSRAAGEPVAPRRIAFSATLDLTVVDSEVEGVCRRAVAKLADAGARVDDDAAPSFRSVADFYPVVRGLDFVARTQSLLVDHREQLRPEMIRNIEEGSRLTAEAMGRAERSRMELHQQLAKFFESHDLLVTPTVIVPPPAIDVSYIEALGEHRFESHIEWFALTYAITAVPAFPALSLPCGYTADGLPIGLQIVGRPYDEAGLLAMAQWIESVLDMARDLPIDPKESQRPS